MFERSLQNKSCQQQQAASFGGGGEIRTHGKLAPTTVFETVPFNRSGTPPYWDLERGVKDSIDV
jgi:hypothetical protein